jgi:hypothetical protein
MNVLEIYPNFAWWFDAPDAAGIEELRATASMSDLTAQAEALAKLRPKQAYYLVGDAGTFDLVPGIFDQIVLRYEPTPLKGLILQRRIQEWIGADGAILYQPTLIQIHEPSPGKGYETIPVKFARLRRC